MKLSKFLVLVLVICSCACFAQEWKPELGEKQFNDSLYNKSTRAGVMDFLWRTSTRDLYDIATIMRSARELETRVESLKEKKRLAQIFNSIGQDLRYLDRPNLALQYYRKQDSMYRSGMGIHSENINLGHCYSALGDQKRAKDYYTRAYKETRIKDVTDTTDNATWAMFHYGRMQLADDSSSAIALMDSAIQEWTNMPNTLREKGALSYAHLVIARHYILEGNFVIAQQYGEKILYYDSLDNNSGLRYPLYNCHYYSKKEQWDKVIMWANEGLRIANASGLNQNKYLNSSFYQFLYTGFHAQKESDSALKYFLLVDSIQKVQEESKSSQIRMLNNFVDQQKAMEVDLKLHLLRNANRNRILIVFAIVLVLGLLAIISRLRFMKKANKLIQIEKERSENLLLNILPAEIAEELKTKGEAAARDFEQVSILFTDFRKFTELSENLTAKELVAELNYCFKSFDAICEKHGIEKIKTLGDSYMAAGGIPVPKEDSTRRLILAALEMSAFVLKRQKEREAESKIPFEMRAGIHTGNVVAGIVGVKKFQYDIWGDTVNTASRMESNGEVGKVNISQATYELIKDDSQFSFEHRGKVEAKGKGKIDMWFVGLA